MPQLLHTTPILCVAGPTGVGKSVVALKLARDLKGEIVSIDSLQVYREFDVGSAKLSCSERQQVPHHLIDILEPTDEWNVKRFVDLAHEAIRDVQSRGKLCIVSGGSTMYYSALLHGLAPLPGADISLRQELTSYSDDELARKLKELDPGSAMRLHSADRRRLIRAIEASFSGIPSEEVRKIHGFKSSTVRALIIVLQAQRDYLYQAINARVTWMIKNGLEQEVARICQKYGEAVHGLRGLGYQQVVSVRRGELSNSLLESEIAKYTRRYAKRQLTFWRNEPGKRGWTVRPGVGEASVEVGSFAQPVKRVKGKSVALNVLSRSYEDLREEIIERFKHDFSVNELWHVCLKLSNSSSTLA